MVCSPSMDTLESINSSVANCLSEQGVLLTRQTSHTLQP